jgi:hypothetical protein
MWIKMYVGTILVDQYEMSYDGIITYADRVKYHQRLAEKLSSDHADLIAMSAEAPKFFIAGQESRASSAELSNRWLSVEDADFIRMLREEFKNEPWYNHNLNIIEYVTGQ